MSSELPQDTSQAPAGKAPQTSDDKRDRDATGNQGRPADAGRQQATILVRGETLSEGKPKSGTTESPAQAKDAPRKAVSEIKVKQQNRLPALDDDTDVGVAKEQVVIRDGKADLAFNGTLLASAAPSAAPTGHWQEYRIYETAGGKHVFSKVTRSVFAEEPDTHQADIFEPSPSSVPSQLLRSARDLTRSHPMTWMDAAVAFFGYDPLAKALYRKLSGQFEEHIS